MKKKIIIKKSVTIPLIFRLPRGFSLDGYSVDYCFVKLAGMIAWKREPFRLAFSEVFG